MIKELKYINLLCLLALIGCGKLEHKIEQLNDVSPFHSVELYSPMEVYLVEGSEFSISFEGDKRDVENVSVSVVDSVLKIDNLRKYKWLNPDREKLKVVITSSPLHYLKSYETCLIQTLTPITSDDFCLEFHGKANEANLELDGHSFSYWNNFECGGKLTLSGKTVVLNLWNFTVVSVDAKELIAQYATVENNSKGDCIITAKEQLTYAIRNIGNIELYGETKNLVQSEVTEAEGRLIVH